MSIGGGQWWRAPSTHLIIAGPFTTDASDICSDVAAAQDDRTGHERHDGVGGDDGYAGQRAEVGTALINLYAECGRCEWFSVPLKVRKSQPSRIFS